MSLIQPIQLSLSLIQTLLLIMVLWLSHDSHRTSTVSRTARSVNNTLDVFLNLLYVSLRMNGMK